jgi:hypothetical protein
MTLTIVLIVFILVFGTMGVLLYLWWRKYGKKLFGILTSLQNMGSQTPKLPNMGDLQNQMKAFNEIMRKMGKK